MKREIPFESEFWKTLKVHPLAGLFPKLSEVDYLALAGDIARNGQLDPVVLDKDILLEGRHRVQACLAVSVPVKVCDIEDADPTIGSRLGTDRERAIESFIWSKNVLRRHLTDDQRSMLVLEFEKYFAEQSADAKTRAQIPKGQTGNPGGKPKTEVGPNSDPPAKRDEQTHNAQKTTGKLAQKAKVSRYKVETARKVKAQSPKLAEKVMQGEIKLATARKAIIERAAKKPQRSQPATADELRAEFDKTWSRHVDVYLGRFKREQHDEVLGLIKAWSINHI
jgi:hypothetical protein